MICKLNWYKKSKIRHIFFSEDNKSIYAKKNLIFKKFLRNFSNSLVYITSNCGTSINLFKDSLNFTKNVFSVEGLAKKKDFLREQNLRQACIRVMKKNSEQV
ncbi:hypothetical protein BpHYR1_017700 [Brachionus plicatilis]|uniref:Uncharacterized protein n=1 Tax=Brachionus plicatilis TaxID=10195 RepID=A0A3M7S8T3_BRAPC|nr:hypothetical protein BpHYR1_017700 [Brachionus plicatilis]